MSLNLKKNLIMFYYRQLFQIQLGRGLAGQHSTAQNSQRRRFPRRPQNDSIRLASGHTCADSFSGHRIYHSNRQQGLSCRGQ